MRFSGVRIDRGERTVLQDVDLAIPAGSVTVIFGPSGAGKSTLLQAATGELVADAGSVRVLGCELPLRHAALFELRRSIGVLLQGSGLLSDLDVFENVALPLRTHTDLPEALVQRIVHMKLNAVGLAGAAELSPQQLSGGMIRRVALARALVLDPPLMLYDEPLTGLDPIAIGVITSLIVGLNRTLGLTSVLVTHHIHESLEIADRVVVIANRTIAFVGTREELASSRDPLLAQFLEGKPDGPMGFDYERAQRREVARAAP
ncbi:MAG TPA: ATP-binding cassette domain-containing protein [Xanthomonadaceae bacterium]|nr:ATP-binding cassette domain-containing protein [Xanthomonadaceae bacterium]